jgi:hypothetical protein
MADDSDEPAPLNPLRRKRADEGPFTHTTFAYRRIGKKFGRYLECGVARVAPCEHCGAPATGSVKVFLDRLVAFGGATGGFLLKANGLAPPQPPRDFPEQTEFDEKEILPES